MSIVSHFRWKTLCCNKEKVTLGLSSLSSGCRGRRPVDYGGSNGIVLELQSVFPSKDSLYPLIQISSAIICDMLRQFAQSHRSRKRGCWQQRRTLVFHLCPLAFLLWRNIAL